jgi:adenylate kinase
VLLDAHSVIDNDRFLIEIPTAVIRPLGVAAILFVEADAGLIARRRLHRSRAAPRRTPEELAAHQDCARNVCTKYSQELGVPLETVTSDAVEAAVDFVKSIVKHR